MICSSPSARRCTAWFRVGDPYLLLDLPASPSKTNDQRKFRHIYGLGWALICKNYGHGKTIVAFAADGLDFGGADARFFR